MSKKSFALPQKKTILISRNKFSFSFHHNDSLPGMNGVAFWKKKLPPWSLFMSADLSVSWHYVVTLRRGRTRPREQLLLQNYKA